jgi:hypothetical protein
VASRARLKRHRQRVAIVSVLDWGMRGLRATWDMRPRELRVGSDFNLENRPFLAMVVVDVPTSKSKAKTKTIEFGRRRCSSRPNPSAIDKFIDNPSHTRNSKPSLHLP